MNSIFCQFIKIDELDAIKITHPLFHATLLLQGAQLIEFAPQKDGYDNLLWLSNSAEYKQGQSIRGGIPICWPWFGDLKMNPEAIQQQVILQQDKHQNLPAHGFVRNISWDIHSIQEDCHEVVIELALDSNKETHSYWPYDFSLKARFSFSQTLTLELMTENKDKDTFNFSQALHTYLPTSDIEQTYIHNAHQSEYIDALDGWKRKRQNGRIAFTQETDRLYFFQEQQNRPIEKQYELRAESPNRQLYLTTQNSLSAVIWNPWINKSLRLSQFSPSDYKAMYCIESANVMEDFKTIAQNEKSSILLKLQS